MTHLYVIVPEIALFVQAMGLSRGYRRVAKRGKLFFLEVGGNVPMQRGK